VALFAVYNSYYYNTRTNYLNLPVNSKISIHITLTTVYLVCSVQSTEVTIVLPNDKWVALTRAGWCVVCGRLSDKLHRLLLRFAS